MQKHQARGLQDNLTARTICCLAIWHQECKADNLAPRTIWHRGQFGTVMKNGQFGTADNLAPQCKTDNLAPDMPTFGVYIGIEYIMPTIGGYV